MELHFTYFVFCPLNPHPIAPSPPMNIPIAFIPTVLGDCGLGSQTQTFDELSEQKLLTNFGTLEQKFRMWNFLMIYGIFLPPVPIFVQIQGSQRPLQR